MSCLFVFKINITKLLLIEVITCTAPLPCKEVPQVRCLNMNSPGIKSVHCTWFVSDYNCKFNCAHIFVMQKTSGTDAWANCMWVMHQMQRWMVNLNVSNAICNYIHVVLIKTVIAYSCIYCSYLHNTVWLFSDELRNVLLCRLQGSN